MAKATKTNVEKEKVNVWQEKSLQDAIKEVEKKFGAGTIMDMASGSIEIWRLSTWSLTLDSILGGGIPEWRITEMYWPESSGKTTIALLVAAEVQRNWGKVVFIDAEQAFNPSFASKLGVSLGADFLLVSPKSWEAAFEVAETMARSWAIKLIIIDSVSALVPQKEIDWDMGDAQMGAQARLMSQGLRKITGILNETKTACIFINQIRMKIGVMFGNPETTSGGQALKFFASIRCDIRKGDKITEWKEQVGHKIKIRTIKNKTYPPYKETNLSLYYNSWFDKFEDIIDAGRLKGVITQSWAYFAFKLWAKEEKFQWKEKLVDFFKENDKVFNELKKQVIKSELLEWVADTDISDIEEDV